MVIMFILEINTLIIKLTDIVQRKLTTRKRHRPVKSI